MRRYPSHPSRYLPGLSEEEIIQCARQPGATAVIPIGAIEQHGPHLPVGVDSILAEGWVDAVLGRLPADCPVFLSLPIHLSKSNEHLDFPGTLSLDKHTLSALFEANVSQLMAWGFRSIVLFNHHGGNTPHLRSQLLEHRQKAPDCVIRFLDFEDVTWGISALEQQYGFHAGELETSWMLHFAPELVDMSKAVKEFPAWADTLQLLQPEDAPATFAWKSNDLSASGVMGDAILANAEKGRLWVEQASQHLAGKLVEMVKLQRES